MSQTADGPKLSDGMSVNERTKLSSLVLNLDIMIMLQLQGRKIDVRQCVLNLESGS